MAISSILRKISSVKAPLAMASAVISVTSASTAALAQVGSQQNVNFGQALITNSCTLTTSDGSIGVSKNRNLITSDIGEGGTYNGALAAATVTAASNLTSNGFVKVENPLLSGGTVASTSQVRLGSSGAWGTTAQANLGTDGSMNAVPLHVRFSTTSNNNRFANGTYTASATVSCYAGI